AKTLATGAPVWEAYDAWLRAELRRAEGRPAPEEWSAAVAALEPLQRPYDLARARLRLAEALLASGPEEDDRARATDPLRRRARAAAVASRGAVGDARARATDLPRHCATAAGRLGARPLARSATRLARRARLTLHPVPRRQTAGPAGPADALGLTGRERDVLRLVAAGHTNRRIAEELFISPKAASVHVSNIPATLGVSARGEAAAVAHRLGLPPAEAGTGPMAG